MKNRFLPVLLLAFGSCVIAANAKDAGRSKKHRDADGDHILSMEEFLKDRKNPDKARKLFGKVDANHDGKIDKDERAEARKQGKKKHGKDKPEKKDDAPEDSED